MTDSGGGLVPGPISLSSSTPASTSNTQCTIYSAWSHVEERDGYSDAQGDHFRQIELTLNISFKPAFAGDKAVYLGSQGNDGNAGWQTSGVWRVPGAPGAALGVSENSDGTHTVTVANITPANVTNVYELINPAVDALHSCYVGFVSSANQAYLMNDAGSAWLLPPVTVGNGAGSHGSGSISNTQCTLNGYNSTFTRASSSVSLTLQISLLGSFATSPTFAWAAALVPASTGWFAENVLGEPAPQVTVNFQQITGPVRIEANLAPVQIDAYWIDSTHPQSNCMTSPVCQTDRNERYVPACDANLSVQQCFRDALNGYGQQGVSGVRFQFGICGGGRSTALVDCDQPSTAVLSSAWVSKLNAFLADVHAAGIPNITPTPSLQGFGNDVGYVPQQTLFDSCTNTQSRFDFWPASPYAIGEDGNPADAFLNNAYNCSQSNPYLVGWDKIFSVFDSVLNKAQANGLMVEEFDLTNEVEIDRFTVEGRLIADNKNPWTDPSSGIQYSYTPVLARLQALMSHYGFAPNGVSGATVSTMVDEASDASADWGSFYGDSARIQALSAWVAAIGGYGFGEAHVPFDPNHGHLRCSSSPPGDLVTTPMPPPSGMTTGLSNIIDQHDGAMVIGTGGPITYQSQDMVKTEAQTTFNATKAFMNSFCAGGWRNPSGSQTFPICNPLYMLGETGLYVPSNPYRYGVNCDESPLATPAGTVQGFNLSSLSGRRLPNGAPGTVWRPWLNPLFVPGPTTVTCYGFPDNLRLWYTPQP